jgi:hypothetical protein
LTPTALLPTALLPTALPPAWLDGLPEQFPVTVDEREIQAVELEALISPAG